MWGTHRHFLKNKKSKKSREKLKNEKNQKTFKFALCQVFFVFVVQLSTKGLKRVYTQNLGRFRHIVVKCRVFRIACNVILHENVYLFCPLLGILKTKYLPLRSNSRKLN